MAFGLSYSNLAGLRIGVQPLYYETPILPQNM